ncbi:MAG: GDSL-type esterase/lipase family protein [Bacteroidales bacterium]|nr:GDSL-type esterase/lipase family protein [Bacteroidales bacterium]
MKKTLIAVLLFIQTLLLVAQTPASSDLISYSGRVLLQDGKAGFDWSGVVVHVKFKGSSLSMKCSDTGCDYFNVWVDKTPGLVQDSVLEVRGTDNELSICSGLKKAEHDVFLQKRTEGEQGRITIESFTTDGILLKAGGAKARSIEFIGDSYTCGYGTEGEDRNEPFRASEENCNLTYAAILGRFFDADVRLVCHSGRGVSRNYDDADPENTMVVRYSRMFDEDPDSRWSARKDGYRPDAVVIYLGTNDFSVGKQPSLDKWCSDYSKLLGLVRDNYGENVPVLCVSSKLTDGYYVREAVHRSGYKNVHWTSIQQDVHNDTTELGSSWHPNYEGHRKVACCMAPYISTITGWDMPVKPLE